MTTATKPTTAEDVLLDCLRPAPWNEERPIDDAYIQTFRDKGQIVTALVRPRNDVGEFEIVFGHRRAAALRAIGAETMRCEIRDLSNEEAEELGALENAQRRGLSWQQQCALIEGYLSRHEDEDAPARIGSALGITTAQVRRRARMLGNLSKSWLDAIKKGELPAWTADHFESLTVFGEEQQESIADDILYEANGITLKDLREQLARDTKVLKGVPWKLQDDTLVPKAGACITCPKRSGANADLFEEVDGKTTKGDRCLDDGCFAQKLTAHAERRETELKEAHPGLIKVSKERYSTHDGIVGSGAYKVVKKSEKGALPAMVTDGNGAGALTYVKVDQERSPAAAASAKRAANGGKTPLKDRKAALEKRRTCLVITKLIEWVNAKDLEWPEKDFNLMVALIHVFGTDRQDTYKTIRFGWAGVKKWTKTPPSAEELWPRVREVLVDQLRGQLNRDKPGMVEAVEIAAIVSADLAALRKEAEAEIPVPKSWADEEAADRMSKKEGRPARADHGPAKEFHEDLEDADDEDFDDGARPDDDDGDE